MKYLFLHRLFIGIVLASLLFVSSCAPADRPNTAGDLRADSLNRGSANKPGIAVVANQVAPLTSAEIREISKAALGGDGRAAFNLYLNYQLAMNDHRNGDFWMRIAAENGSVIGIHNYVDEQILSNRVNEDTCRRAYFWLNRAKASASSRETEIVSLTQSLIREKCLSLGQ